MDKVSDALDLAIEWANLAARRAREQGLFGLEVRILSRAQLMLELLGDLPQWMPGDRGSSVGQ